MLIIEILHELYKNRGYFPKEAVTQAIEKQKEITPVLLDILNYAIENPVNIPFDRHDHIFSLYLLAYFKETAAFPSIMRLANLNEFDLEDLLGDLISEELTRCIISTYNGNLTLIKNLIENQYAYIYARSAGLSSLLGLINLNIITRDEVLAYYKYLLNSFLTHDDPLFTAMLISDSCDLYPKEIYEDIVRAYENNRVETDFIDMDSVNEALEIGKDACFITKSNIANWYSPIHNVEYDMEWMFKSAQENDRTDQDECNYTPSFGYTYTRSEEKIGRNQQCPCESGKKYKKCCLISL